MSPHLPVLPIVLPLLAGAAMVLLDERRHALKAAIGLASTLGVLASALALAAAPATLVYALGNWPAPFGIVLVADRLSAALVLLAAALTLASLVFSLARWHHAGPHFHTLVQFLLAGLSGAFLTGDLFNLFVFFELLLAASYGLALYGGGVPRVQAGLHYIVVNLAASLLFLVGVSLMYGVTGTLNIADLAQRMPGIPPGDRVLLEIGGAPVTAAALYYLVASTLGTAALFLLIELVERVRRPGADLLAVTADAFGLAAEDDEPEDEAGVAIPASMAVLGLSFGCAALLVAGLPPLPGFVAKFAILAALFEADPVRPAAWTLLALLVVSGLAAVIALSRAGVRVFWGGEEALLPRVRVLEFAPIAALLAGCIALTVAAGPAMRYAGEAAQALHDPRGYVERVLTP